jgi:hypothetical protein
MKTTMKKLMMLVVMMAAAGGAMAASTDTVTLTVTPTGTKSLSIDLASFDFGSLVLATTGNLSTSATVTNDGNIVSTWALRVSVNDGVWTAATGVQAPAADRYKLMALFDDPAVGGAPVSATFDTTNDAVVSAGVGAGTLSSATVYSGDQTGENVTVSATRGLWFRLDMPTSSTVGTQRSFTVELEAR